MKTHSSSTFLNPNSAQLVHTPSQQTQTLIASLRSDPWSLQSSRSHPTTRQQRTKGGEISPPRIKHSPNPPQDILLDEDGAPVLLVRNKELVTILPKTTQGIEVKFPLNPASCLNIQPTNDSDLSGAVAGVYKHKTQEKAKYLTILYTNLSDNPIILTPGVVCAHATMCKEEKSTNVKMTAVNPNIKTKEQTDKLWKDLKLENNEILKENSKLKKMYIC